MTEMDCREQLVRLLDRALSAEVRLDESTELVSRMNPGEESALIGAAHLLVHFCTDVDIRSRDPAYDALMRRQIREALIALGSQ